MSQQPPTDPWGQQPNPPPPQQPWQQPPAPRKNRTLLIVLAAVGGAALLGVVGVVALLALVASSAPQTALIDQAAATTSTAATATMPTAPTATEPDPADSAPTEHPIGSAWLTYEDGVEIRVTKVGRAKLDAYDSVRNGYVAIVATVQVRNGTKDRIDGSLTYVKARYGPDGQEAEFTVVGSYNQITASAVAPGRTVTGHYCFEVPRGTKNVTIEATPGFDYQSYAFTGKLT